MVKRTDTATADNIIYLFGARRRGHAAEASVASEGAERRQCATSKEEVFFIRAGIFQCMINGAVGVVRAGDFVRVGHGATYAFREIGERPGLMFSRLFPSGVDARLLTEIGAAIPASAREFPKPGSPEFCRLCAIAKRWGLELDEDGAAA